MLFHHSFLSLSVATLLVATGSAQSCGGSFDLGVVPTREIHVATWGDDVTGDGSAQKPYATIAFAARRATPGTAVQVHPGTYPPDNTVYDLAGTRAAPIWIGGYGGTAKIAGGQQALHLIRPHWVVVHDLEVANAAANGINCDDGGEYGNPTAATDLILRDLYVHDIGQGGNEDGLKLSGVNDYVVLDCTIERCGGNGSGSGIDHVGCHHGWILRCTIRDTSANAIQCKGGSADIEIRWCRLIDPGERGVNIGGNTGLGLFRPPLSTTAPNVEARNIRVLANEIVGGRAAVAFVGAVECVVSQNTIIDPDEWLLRILQETLSGGGYTFTACGSNAFTSNLLWFDDAALHSKVNIGPGTDPTSFVFGHDLWYAHDAPQSSAPNLPVPETAGLIGLDPKLLDPAAGNYALALGSPAAGAGWNKSLVAGDITGRCYRQPPAIGAHEAP